MEITYLYSKYFYDHATSRFAAEAKLARLSGLKQLLRRALSCECIYWKKYNL